MKPLNTWWRKRDGVSVLFDLALAKKLTTTIKLTNFLKESLSVLTGIGCLTVVKVCRIISHGTLVV